MTEEKKDIQNSQEDSSCAKASADKQEKGCAKCAEWNDKYLHLAADYQNYQKRTEKDRALWISNAQQEMLLRVIKIVDDFDRALEQHKAQEHSDQLDAWLEGFELIGKSFNKLLDQYSVKKITQYDQFNPELHEAVAHVDSPDHEAGAIVRVYEPGYMIDEKILRPAKVTVAK